MTANTVRKVIYSGELSKDEARRNHIDCIDALTAYIMQKDGYPLEGQARNLSDPGAEEEARTDLPNKASIDFFKTAIGRYMRVTFSALEYYKTDDAGDFLEGSDFDDFGQFSEDDKQNIIAFIL